MKYQIVEKKVAYFYTLVILILFAVPTYFAISFALQKEILINELELAKYANELEVRIQTNEIAIAQSIKFKHGLYDKNGKELVSYLNNNFENINFKTYLKYPYLYYKKEVNKNNFDIAFIITQVEINYQKLIFIASLIFIIILVNIYILNKAIIESTAQPYELLQQYMSNFFNDTMHELKTPLGIININVDLLTNKHGENRYTQRIKSAQKQMQITYEDIEYYIKHKNVKYVREKIDLSYFVGNRVDFFADLAFSKDIKIYPVIEPNIYIFINSQELQRLVDNTLSNAIKYSHPQNKIELNLAQDGVSATLSIKDYGMGIVDIKKVFERFSREDTVQGGFGLGLNIVNNICKKNDIKLIIDSKPNIGSTFTYQIPLYKKKFLDTDENEI